VQCVQILPPNWAEEDLLVLARPFSLYHGNQMSDIEFVLGALRLEDWTALSEIEQADEFSDRSLIGKLQSTQTPKSVPESVAKFCVRVGDRARAFKIAAIKRRRTTPQQSPTASR